MTDRHRSRSRFGQGQRRLTSWSPGPGGNDLATLDAVAISTSTDTIIGLGQTPTVDRFTIVRIHGFLELSLETAGAVASGFSWAAGIGIFTTDAFADVGATAMPSPFDDIDWPGWMWHQQGALHTTQGAVAVGDPSINPVVIPVDTKAMRILRNNETVGMVLQSGESGVSIMRVRASTRMLVKIA